MTVGTAAPAVVDIRQGLSLRRQVVIAAQEWMRRHAVSIAMLTPILVAVGVVHGVGSSTFPRYVDDPGTYLSQAWALRYDGTLSPYSYFYDHAPAGWMQIALYALLTDGFDRRDSVMAFGAECMMMAKLASTALLYALARRLGFSRVGAALATILFGLCPLGVVYGRWTFLDNLVVPWLLAAFLLACSPRRSIWAATAAALAFAMAALTKETTLLLLPAFAWALAQNLDRRNRAQVVTVAAFSGVALMAAYPLFALYKGELLPGEEHNSLLGTAAWQLAGRESTGSVLDTGSPMRTLLDGWLGYDPYLLAAGLVALPMVVFARRLRPAALALAIGWLMTVRGGYVPFMHVITLLPWSALLAAGALEVLAGNRLRADIGVVRHVRTPVGIGRRLRIGLFGLVGAALLAALSVPWAPDVRAMMTVPTEQPLRSATTWVAAHVPRDATVVVHDTIWTDLVHHHGFAPRPIIAHKLDNDPAVRDNLERVDYLVVPNWYYAESNAGQYPTLVEARRHAVPVATFGSGGDGVRVYRVSRFWEP